VAFFRVGDRDWRNASKEVEGTLSKTFLNAQKKQIFRWRKCVSPDTYCMTSMSSNYAVRGIDEVKLI
jgi:hypothetical protein